jgi:flagella basal body P-ring formation protein FlgA
MNLDTAVPAFGAPRTGRLNPMIVLRLAAIAAGLCLVFSPAFAAEQLRLKSEVTVNADVLTLGDLAEGVSGPAAETPVFRAPAPGETGTIQAARITEVASRFGLAFEPGRRLRQIVVTRASRRVAAAEIEAAVKRAIELQHGVDARGLSIVLDTGSPALRLAPDSTAPITADAISFDRRSRRFSALVSAGGDPSSSVRLSGTAAELVDVALLNRSLNRGETVQASDLSIERRPRETVSGDVQLETASLAGRIARRSLAAGSVLRAGDLGKPDVVSRGEIVTVVYEIPGMMLTLRGRATEAGAQGESIGILNIQSKKTLQATVAGPGKVSIAAPIPGPLAANTAAQAANR